MNFDGLLIPRQVILMTCDDELRKHFFLSSPQNMYWILYNPSTHWIGWAVIIFFLLITPVLLWLAHKNPFTRDVVLNGWEPVIAAMTISRYEILFKLIRFLPGLSKVDRFTVFNSINRSRILNRLLAISNEHVTQY